MNFTNHALQRYCKRFLGFEVEKDTKKYVNENRDKLENDIQELFKKAKHVYTGIINNDIISKSFHIKDDICFVCSEDNSALITMFKLEYGFGKEIDKCIIKGLLKDLEDNKSRESLIKDRIANELPKKQQELDVINKEIKIIEDQLDIYKYKKQLVEEEINGYSKDIEFNNLEKLRTAYKLIYCINYKLDCCNNKNVNAEDNTK